VGEGIAGWVAQNCKPLLVPDVTKDPRFYKQADEKSKFVTKSILAVPLMAHQKLIGVVEVLNKKSGESFAPEDVTLLEALAHQSAVAIENAKLYRDLQSSFLSTVSALAAAVDAKDSYTAGHAQRVTEYSVHIAEEMGLSAADVETVRLSGLMHDLGKIGISESILSKPGRLTDEEFAEMKRHPGVGATILSSVQGLAHVIPGIHRHHERVDGRGYPDGLKGDDIPLVGRIIGVADTFDAMTSDRVYRHRLTDQEGIDELKRFSGQQFDAKVVEAFLKAYEKGKIKTIPAKS
jgi:putative nucleotidyltransferase with HDIG domain